MSCELIVTGDLLKQNLVYPVILSDFFQRVKVLLLC